MNTTEGKALTPTTEANKRHLEWFFERAEAPVEYLAREIARAGNVTPRVSRYSPPSRDKPPFRAWSR